MIFTLVFAALFTHRIIAVYGFVDNANREARSVIETQIKKISEGVRRQGVVYAKRFVLATLENNHNKNLYLAVNIKGKTTGNIPEWPVLPEKTKGYYDIALKNNNKPPLHLLVKTIVLPRDIKVLVGYSLKYTDEVKKNLPEVALEDIMLAFGVASVVSFLTVGLLSMYMRRFNIACAKVMRGDLNYRIKTTKSGDEFDKLANNINLMLEWNRTLITTARDTSTAIAHDIRTPLSRLRLELRALSERPRLNEETKAAVLEHVERVDGLIEMFEDILNIAKAESRFDTEIFEVFNFKQLVQDVLDFYAPIIEEKHLDMHATLPEISLMVKGDKQLLGQAVVNLVDNACKYTPEDGKITVTLAKEGQYIVLMVSDNGFGIPETLRERVKERFFRVDQSRSSSGHGLGLSLVNAVAVLHWGTFMLEDNYPGLKAVLTIQGEG